MNPKLVRVTRSRTIRLIGTAGHKPPVLESLARSFDARTDLEDLESVTSGRLEAQQKGVPGIGPQALATGYGYSYINAAFAYRRPNGNRFNPPEWGAWYCSFDEQTAIAEVGYHLTRSLEAAGYFDNTTRCIELLADFDAEFADVSEIDPKPTYLSPDCDVAYPAGQKLANELRSKGLNGIQYPSVRLAGGVCLVAFWPGLIQNFQQGATWEFKWAGSASPSVQKV